MSAVDLFREIVDAGWDGVEAWKADGASETSDLEFKTSDWRGTKLGDEDRKSLGKVVSGFANTDGGVIAFGVKTKKVSEGADRVEAVQQIRDLQLYVDKLNEHIGSCTDPTVPGAKAVGIYNPAAENMGVAVVVVPGSDGGPHRARHSGDKWSDRYFIRAGTSTGVMAHSTLAALFGRRPGPKLSVEITHLPGSHGSERWTLAVRNSGRGIARSVLLRYRLRHDESPDQTDLTKHLMSGPAAPSRWHGWQRAREPVPQDPRWWFVHESGLLYPEDVSVACNLGLSGNPHGWVITGRVDADGAQPVAFEGHVHVNHGSTIELPTRGG